MVDLGWRIDAGKILTRRELALVLDDLAHKADRFANARLNRVICRLACCCGLRVSEISALQLGDVRLESSRPHLRLRVARPRAARRDACRYGGTRGRWPTSAPGRPSVCSEVRPTTVHSSSRHGRAAADCR